MTSYLFKNATLLTLYPLTIEQADLRVADGKITANANDLEPLPGETVLNVSGKILMPGMVCAHTHLYSVLARGMPGPVEAPTTFPQILERVWWPLDRALDEESLYYSTVIGVLEALLCGTTTIIDHNASPGYLRGSLKLMKTVFEDLGIRGVLCYEVTDRNGLSERDAGLEENRWLLEHQTDLVKGLVGAHAGFTLSDASLRLCGELIHKYHSGLHIHIAEDRCDVEQAQAQYGKSPIARLQQFGLLNNFSLFAHGVHLGDHDVAQIAQSGGWLIHNPRSNMNNAVGYFRAADFSARFGNLNLALGTDGIGANMFEELKYAYFKAQDVHCSLNAETVLRLLTGGQCFASTLFNQPIGSLKPDAAADLIVLDYPTPTPLQVDNLCGHLIFGMSHAHVTDVMVAGVWRVQNRQIVGQDVAALYRQAQATARKLWQRMGKR